MHLGPDRYPQLKEGNACNMNFFLSVTYKIKINSQASPGRASQEQAAGWTDFSGAGQAGSPLEVCTQRRPLSPGTHIG